MNLIQNQFTLENFEDDFVRKNLIVKWDEFTVTENADSSISYEFLTNLNSTASFNDSKNNLYTKYILRVTIVNNKVLDFKIVKFLGKNNNLLKDISLKSVKGFNGTIYHYNLRGDLVKLESFEKGKMVHFIENKSSNLNNLNAREPIVEGYVLMITERYTDWYFNLGTAYYYTKSHLISRTLQYVYVGSNASNYNPDSVVHEHYAHSPSPAVPVDNHLDEIIIDTTFTNIPKINCTFNQLMKTGSMKAILVDFFGANALYKLKFQVVENLICNTNGDVNGCATNTLNSDGSVTISIDKAYINDVNTPTLFLAKTIVHEAIHANIYAEIKKLNNGITPPNSDFAILFEEYGQKMNWSHELMANKYLSTISQSIRNVHSLLGDQTFITDRNSFSGWNWDKFYEEVAWLGLYDTTKGKEHLLNPNYTNNSNLYVKDTQVDSTKNPKCD